MITRAKYLSGCQGYGDRKKKAKRFGPTGPCGTVCLPPVHLSPQQPYALIHKRETAPHSFPRLWIGCGCPHHASPSDRLCRCTLLRGDIYVTRQHVHFGLQQKLEGTVTASSIGLSHPPSHARLTRDHLVYSPRWIWFKIDRSNKKWLSILE